MDQGKPERLLLANGLKLWAVLEALLRLSNQRLRDWRSVTRSFWMILKLSSIVIINLIAKLPFLYS
jgi:hypothetical protein